MGTIAKSSITLSSISDAYSVSLSPSVCVIHADFDGSNPVLTNAYTIVSVYCGEVKVPFTVKEIAVSNDHIVWHGNKDGDDFKLVIRDIASDVLEGYLDITVDVNGLLTLQSRFIFSVERESTMLDWIQEWQNNKTTIGSSSIITPKLFVGKKITGSYDSLSEVPGLTGVYIGPSANDSCGVYGYKESKEIFHLDETGGKIGGWDISEEGLYSSNGKLRILSDGSIYAVNDELDPIWEIRSNGYASFAMENVRFYANGDAEFTGSITTSEGNIGGWIISKNQIFKDTIGLDCEERVIGVAHAAMVINATTGELPIMSNIRQSGGVGIYYTSSSDWGLAGYSVGTITKAGKKLFALGSQNFIAGWNFDDTSLYIGTKNNNADQYTDASGSLTIGTEGLRGYAWHIDKDGTASFVKGLVSFGLTSGIIAGWTFIDNKFAQNHIALTCAQGTAGLYMTSSDEGNFIERGADAMEGFIDSKGGIYMKVKSDSADFAAYDTNGSRLFKIKSNGPSYIAGWCFNDTTLYTGTQVTTGYTTSGNITIGPTGLRGYKWRFENDGSGAVAGGNIEWDKDGNVTFADSVQIGWSNLGSTIIDNQGIFTGKISADNITAGTISTANIQNADKTWFLDQDGSGMLAGGKIKWDKKGNTQLANLKAESCIFKNVKINGTVSQPWTQSGIYITIGGDDEKLTFDNIAAGASGGWQDGSINSMISWTLADSGRIIRIANWRWGDEIFTSTVTIKAPDGKYFFEDGIAKSKIEISREIITLMGYADSTTFYGWVVIGRVNFNTVSSYGRELRALAMGIVTDNNKKPLINYNTFDNSTLSVERLGTGSYKISIPTSWGLKVGAYQVMLTGYGGSLLKANLANPTNNSFEVQISDDASANDGDFQFQIFNMNDWLG